MSFDTFIVIAIVVLAIVYLWYYFGVKKSCGCDSGNIGHSHGSSGCCGGSDEKCSCEEDKKG